MEKMEAENSLLLLENSTMKKKITPLQCCLGCCGITVFLISAFIVGYLTWALNPLGRPLNAEVLTALESSENVTVAFADEGGYYTFTHANSLDNGIGFIFYPGGHVDFRTYAPVLHSIANKGFFVALLSVNLNLAIMDGQKADVVLAANKDDYSKWFVGGHSLGAAVSTMYAHSHEKDLTGVIVFDGYATEGADLSLSYLSCLSIQSGLKTEEKRAAYDAASRYWPEDVTYVVIEGANHAQFGDYGLQGGDTTATISREEQQWHTMNATVAFLERFTP